MLCLLGELNALERAQKETKGLIEMSNSEVKEAGRQWKESATALRGFVDKYNKERINLDLKRQEFEVGIKQHFTEEIAVGVVNVLGAVGSIFFGGFDLETIKDAAESSVKLKRLARVIQRITKVRNV